MQNEVDQKMVRWSDPQQNAIYAEQYQQQQQEQLQLNIPLGGFGIAPVAQRQAHDDYNMNQNQSTCYCGNDSKVELGAPAPKIATKRSLVDWL